MSDNARRLVARPAGRAPAAMATLERPRLVAAGRRDGGGRMRCSARRPRPLVGVHASGGRESTVAPRSIRRRSRARSSTRARRDDRAHRIGRPTAPWSIRCAARARRRRASSTSRRASTCSSLAALLARLDVLVTGDTGPMHLAAAVGTPVVALFGPSDPAATARCGDDASRRARRSAVQPVRPGPAAARALPRARAGLHGRHQVDAVVARRARSAGSSRRDRQQPRVMSTGTIDRVRRKATASSRATSRRSLDAGAARDARASKRIAWIKRLRLVRTTAASRCASGSRIRGDSLWWFTELYLHKMRQLDARRRRRCSRSTRPSRVHAPTRIGGRRRRRGRAATPRTRVRRGAHGMPVGMRGRPTRAARGATRMAELPGRPDARGCRVCAAAAHAPSAPRRRVAAFVHTRVLASRRGDDGPSAGKLHRPRARGARIALGAGELTLRRRRPATEFPRAALVGSVDAGPTGAADRRRSSSSRRAQRSRDALRALARARDGSARDLTRATASGRRRHLRGCDLWPVLRARARGRGAAAVAVVGARDGRSRRRARRARPRRRRHLRRSRRLGPRAGARGAPPRHPVRRPSARLHLPALAELPARSRTRCSRSEPTTAAFPRPDRTLLFDRYARATPRARADTFPPSSLAVTGSARLDELARARRALRQRETRGDAAPVGAATAGALVVLAAKFTRDSRRCLPRWSAAVGAAVRR